MDQSEGQQAGAARCSSIGPRRRLRKGVGTTCVAVRYHEVECYKLAWRDTSVRLQVMYTMANIGRQMSSRQRCCMENGGCSGCASCMPLTIVPCDVANMESIFHNGPLLA